MSTFSIYTDGGARGNPGPAATGIIIKDETNKTIATYGEYLGNTTNNVAEYSALISALKKAKTLGGTKVICHADSKLVIEQVSGRWKVKEPHLQTLVMEAYKLLQTFTGGYSLRHIPREKNKEADAEVNKVLDQR